MIPEAAGVIIGVAISAAFIGGWFLALRLIRSNSDARTDTFDAEIRRQREDAHGALATISAMADSRIEDAQKHVAVMEQAADTLLKAAHTERAAADALTAATDQAKRLEEQVALLRQVCESIDAQQGAILTAMTNFGLMQQVDLARKKDRQYGEHDPDRVPPLVERDEGKPLDTLMR